MKIALYTAIMLIQWTTFIYFFESIYGLSIRALQALMNLLHIQEASGAGLGIGLMLICLLCLIPIVISVFSYKQIFQ